MQYERGEIENATRRDLERLKLDLAKPTALAATALRLARMLDHPSADDAPRDMAMVAREFRATMETLEVRGGRNDGDNFLAGLMQAPMGNTPKFRAADSRP